MTFISLLLTWNTSKAKSCCYCMFESIMLEDFHFGKRLFQVSIDEIDTFLWSYTHASCIQRNAQVIDLGISDSLATSSVSLDFSLSMHVLAVR